jgi:hypothetical protein
VPARRQWPTSPLQDVNSRTTARRVRDGALRAGACFGETRALHTGLRARIRVSTCACASDVEADQKLRFV